MAVAAPEIYSAFHGRLMSLRRTGRASVDAVTRRDGWHRPRYAAGSHLGRPTHTMC